MTSTPGTTLDTPRIDACTKAFWTKEGDLEITAVQILDDTSPTIYIPRCSALADFGRYQISDSTLDNT